MWEQHLLRRRLELQVQCSRAVQARWVWARRERMGGRHWRTTELVVLLVVVVLNICRSMFALFDCWEDWAGIAIIWLSKAITTTVCPTM